MTEGPEKSKFKVIEGGSNFAVELSSALQDVLRSLPDDAQSKADYNEVFIKRSEVILWTNKKLLEYLQGDDLFKNSDAASLTWAVIEVAKGKVTQA